MIFILVINAVIRTCDDKYRDFFFKVSYQGWLFVFIGTIIVQ